MAKDFEALAKEFSAVSGLDTVALQKVADEAWHLLIESANQIDWPLFGIDSEYITRPGSNWESFADEVGRTGNVRDAHPDVVHSQTWRDGSDRQAKSRAYSAVCRWLYENAGSCSHVKRLSKLTSLARRHSDTFTWKLIWDWRDSLTKCDEEIAGFKLLRSHRLRTASNSDEATEDDSELKVLCYARAMTLSDFSTMWRDFFILEHGLRTGFPVLYSLSPFVRLDMPRPSDEEMFEYAKQCRQIEAGLLAVEPQEDVCRIDKPPLHVSTVGEVLKEVESMSGDLWDAVRVAITLKDKLAVGKEHAREFLAALSPLHAESLGRCLKRLGWWLADDERSLQERLIGWLFRDEVTELRFVDGKEAVHVVTPAERIQQAVEGIASMAECCEIPADSCLAAARCVGNMKLTLDSYKLLPLGQCVRRSDWPNEVSFDAARLSRIRFDGECLSAALNSVATKLELTPGRIMWQEPTGHPITTERRALDDVKRFLEDWLGVLEPAIQKRGELPTGWEPNGTAWPVGPIQNVKHLRAWLAAWLRGIQDAWSTTGKWASRPESYLDDIRRELRNSERAREAWGLSFPTEFKTNPTDIHEAEEQLKLLINGPLKPAGNELNFDFPPKAANKDFQLGALNDKIQRFQEFLSLQLRKGLGDPSIRWSADQWSEEYWPNVRRHMKLIWASLPEDFDLADCEVDFEGLEDLLQKVKFRYFESIGHVAQFPVDELLFEQLGCHADVLKDCPEPGEPLKPVEKLAGGDGRQPEATSDPHFQLGETGVNPFQSRVDARHDERAEFSYASACITGLLRAVALADDLNFNPVTLIVFAEQTQPEMRPWYDRLVTHPDYAGTVTCRPWETDATISLVAPTANEVCAMLLRSVYLTLMPDKPVLFGAPGQLKNAVERIREHVAANKDALQQRFDHVCKSMNVGEWLALIALAEVERARLQHETPKPIDEAPTEATAEPTKPVEPQAGGEDPRGRKGKTVDGQANLRSCDIKAGSQYKRAMENNPKLQTDQDAYNWFVEHLADDEELPNFDTWSRQLRNFRKASGTQKNKRGVGHETRSVVSITKIEQ